MVKLGPDLYTGRDSYSGYQPGGVFNGFSMLHEHGTGGAPKYGVVSQMPVLGDIVEPLQDHTDSRKAPDEAQLGYYKASLGSGVTVELGATARAGLYKYTFPAGSSGNVIVDVSHVLPSFRGMGLGQNYLGGAISVNELSGGKLEYRGSGSYDNVSSSHALRRHSAVVARWTSCSQQLTIYQGWNRSPKWTVFFCGSFSAPATFKTFLGKAPTGTEMAKYTKETSVSSVNRLGAVFSFNASTVTVNSRVGVSFISEDQACGNVNSQIPEGTSLETVSSNLRKLWTDEILSKVTTSETDTTKLQLLYTSLYHMNLLPTNKTGENPEWTSTEPYYDDSFTLWDLVRLPYRA
jgi:putative alpha-1,2-mannosidase